jgi:hypothetical protein
MDEQSLRHVIEDANRRRLEMAAQIRRRGRADYVVRFGVLRIGMGVAAFLWLISVLFFQGRGLAPFGSAAIPDAMQWAVIALALGIVSGGCWGFFMWSVFERRWFVERDRGTDSEEHRSVSGSAE